MLPSGVDDPNSSPSLIQVVDDFLVRVFGLYLGPKELNFAAKRRLMAGDIVKYDDAPFADQGRVHFEVCLDALIRMISINQQHIEFVVFEDRRHLIPGFYTMRVASQKMQGLSGKGQSSEDGDMKHWISSSKSSTGQINADHCGVGMGKPRHYEECASVTAPDL